MTSKHRPLFTLRVDQLAGRDIELQKLQKAIDQLQQDASQPFLFYIAGDGGLGKTRMLEWVRDYAACAPKTICTHILDFYYSNLRTDVDLIEQIYEDIESQVQDMPQVIRNFATYANLRDRFRRQQVGATQGQGRDEVIQAFHAGWQAMYYENYRLIVLLDTAELLRFEDDPLRKLLGGLMPVASSRRWLSEVIDGSRNFDEQNSILPGVLFVIAGRKDESRELYNELYSLASVNTNNPEDHIIELQGLTRHGLDEYFAELAQKLDRAEYGFEASQLRDDLHHDLRDAFYLLTGGSPIALTIALQLYIDGGADECFRLVNEQINRLPQPIPDSQRRLQQALVTALAEQQVFDAASIAIRYMSVARQGLTPGRLRNLLPQTAKIEYDSIFRELEQLIFVKKRTDGSLVLHDKIADWTEEGFYTQPRQRQAIYQRLTHLYDAEIAEIDQEIDALSTKSDPITSVAEEETGATTPFREITQLNRDPFEYENSHEFRLARRNRRNLLVDRMTYALRANPVTGYKQYYELAEEAFNVGRMDYESQIRSEFLSWWDHQEPINSGNFKNRLLANDSGLNEEYVWADFALRTVQREYNNDAAELSPALRARRTVALVGRIFEFMQKGQLLLPSFAQALLHVYADMANGLLAESDEQIENVRASFAEHIKQLDALLAESRQRHQMSYEDARAMPLETFLTLNALAFANYEFGFFESNHGNHGSAIQHYTDSLFPYRQLGFEINQARSLNDKAYSLAMVGDSDSAETAISDALNLRKHLGFSFLTALSYNTMCIVRTMGERPITAIQYGDYALRVFQALSHDYGQMIANRALSEAYRRSAEFAQQDPRTEMARLEQALVVCTDAVSIARQVLKPNDLFLAEVLDELGCVYRDLVRFRLWHPELCADKYLNAYDESRKLLDEASDVARKLPSARSYLIDSMINRAYLCYYQLAGKGVANLSRESVLVETRKLIDDALAEIPDKYRQPADNYHAADDLTVYWAHLAKAHSLLVRVVRFYLQENNLASDKRSGYEEELLKQCSYTLYFRSLLAGNVRNMKKSHQAVYEALQGIASDHLKRLHDCADDVAKELGLPLLKESQMRKFLRENLGVR